MKLNEMYIIANYLFQHRIHMAASDPMAAVLDISHFRYLNTKFCFPTTMKKYNVIVNFAPPGEAFPAFYPRPLSQ